VAGTTPIFGGQAATPPPSQPTPPPAAPPAQASGGGSIFGGQPAAAAPPPAGSNAAYQHAGQTTQSIFGNIPAATGQVASGASKALDAQGWLARKALTGGESDTDKQMTAIRHHIPGMDFVYDKVLNQQNPALGPNMGPLEGPIQAAGRGIDHAARGLIDAALEGSVDPLTYESFGAGPALKSLGISAKAAPFVMRMINKDPTEITPAIYDALHWGGPAARGGHDVPLIRGAANVADRRGSIVQQHIMERVDNIVNGKPITTAQGRVRPGTMLNDEERMNVAKALKGETPTEAMAPKDSLTPNEQAAYRQLRSLTQLDYHLRRDAAKTVLQRNYGNQLGEDEMNELLDKEVPKRENYMPSAHVGERGTGRPGFTPNPTDYRDPRNLPQENFEVRSPEDLQNGFKAMASNTGRQVATKTLHDLLGDLLDKPEVKSMFDEVVPATGDARTKVEKWKDWWTAAIGYPRAGIVSLTPRHGANIYDLLVNTVPPQELPKATAKMAALVPQLMKASPRQYRELTRGGEELGALSGGFAERKPFFQNIPGLAKYTAFNNKLVWAIDDAAKQTYAEIMHQTGEAQGLHAGGLASQRLVDYEHLAPIQKALRYVAPFGTFRGGIPGAVGGGMLRNPARAAFINRATGGTAYGNKPQPGQEGWQMFNPTADVGRALTIGDKGSPTQRAAAGPAEFMRSTLGEPLKTAVGLVNPWMEYGQSPVPTRMANGKWDPGTLAQYALSGAPGASVAQAILEGMGFSKFKWRGLANEAMRQTLGVQHITPSP
jgi:hypothetical protein